MAAKDYYFSTSVLSGVGKLFFLKIPQLAMPGSGPAGLIGSLAQEGDGGLFGNSEYPIPQNGYILGAILKAMTAILSLSPDEALNEIDLAGVRQTLKLEKSLGGDLNAPFPGAPLSLGIGLNYKRVRSIDVAFGEGARKLFIPRALLEEAYRKMAAKSADYPAVFFDEDYMVVDQALLVRNCTLTVTSDAEFSADFDAKATEMTGMGLGVKYDRKSSKSYALNLGGDKEYLFAIGAVEADKFVH